MRFDDVGTHDKLQTAVRAAEALCQQGDSAAALDAYRKIVLYRLTASGSDRPFAEKMTAADLFVIERLAGICVTLGQIGPAAQLLSTVSDACDAAGNRYAADCVRLKRIQLAVAVSDFVQAAALFDRLTLPAHALRQLFTMDDRLPEWERTLTADRWPNRTVQQSGGFFAAFYSQAALWLASDGEYGVATVAVERGLKHVPPDDETNIGTALRCLRAMIRVEQGGSVCDEFAGLDQDELLRTPELAVRILELRGRRALIRGEFAEAKESFQQTIDACTRAGNRTGRCGAMLNLGRVLIQLNQLVMAGDLIGAVQHEAGLFGDGRLSGEADLLFAVARIRLQSPAGSSPFLDSVERQWNENDTDFTDPQQDARPATGEDLAWLAETPRPQSYLSWFEGFVLRFHVLLGARRTSDAMSLLEEVRSRFSHAESTVIRLRLSYLQAVADYRLGRITEAANRLEEAQAQCLAAGMLPEAWQAARMRGWCARRLNMPPDKQDKLTRIAEEILDRMTARLSPEEAAVFRLNKWVQDEDYLASEINAVLKIRQTLVGKSWLRRLMAERRYRDLLTALGNRMDGYRCGSSPAGVAKSLTLFQCIARIWNGRLGRFSDRMTVSFLVLPDRVAVLRRYRGTFDLAVRSVSRVRIRELVKAWHADTRAYALESENGQTFSGDVVAELTDALGLSALLRDLPPTVRSLVFVPDDVLHGFPFAAVRHGGRYVIESIAVSIAYRCGKETDTRHCYRPPRTNAKGLLVGVTRGNQDYQALPECGVEIDKVTAWLEARHYELTVLRDDRPADGRVVEEADRERVLSKIGDVDFLHVACHGKSSPQQPLDAGLVLLPGGETQILSTADFRSLRLSRLEHVTLSSCWAADNFVYPGRWIISFPETLIRSGARRVIGCLWPVQDALGAAFILSFYEHLESFRYDEALRRTQLKFIETGTRVEDGETDLSHPLFWAGFQLYCA